MLTVAFDVDGTLITKGPHSEDIPRYEVIKLFHALEALGCEMFIWSGGGEDYARHWRAKLGLRAHVAVKGSFKADLAIDDLPSDDIWNEKMKQTLGTVLLKV